jgi:hypothetical protein
MPLDHPDLSTPAQSPRPEAGLPLDGPPPKPPALSWEERPAFREIFLMHFPPLAADAFREAGRHLYDAVLEHELREPEEPWVHARVRALAADLRFTAQVLATLAEARIEAGLTADEFALAMKAETWSAEVAAVCLAIEGALEREARP